MQNFYLNFCLIPKLLENQRIDFEYCSKSNSTICWKLTPFSSDPINLLFKFRSVNNTYIFVFCSAICVIHCWEVCFVVVILFIKKRSIQNRYFRLLRKQALRFGRQNRMSWKSPLQSSRLWPDLVLRQDHIPDLLIQN
jgi:hypothetical protein